MSVLHFALGLAVGVLLTALGVHFNLQQASGEAHPSVEAESSFTDTTGLRSVVLSVNQQKYSFLFHPEESGVHLATEFCTKLGPTWGFTKDNLRDCVARMERELDAKLAEQQQIPAPVTSAPVDLTAAVDAAGELPPGARHLRLTINEVVYVFEYHADHSPEFAAPRLASEFCYSDKGLQTVGPLSEESQQLAQVEREALLRQEVEARCVKPVLAALLAEMAKAAA